MSFDRLKLKECILTRRHLDIMSFWLNVTFLTGYHFDRMSFCNFVRITYGQNVLLKEWHFDTTSLWQNVMLTFFLSECHFRQNCGILTQCHFGRTLPWQRHYFLAKCHLMPKCHWVQNDTELFKVGYFFSYLCDRHGPLNILLVSQYNQNSAFQLILLKAENKNITAIFTNGLFLLA